MDNQSKSKASKLDSSKEEIVKLKALNQHYLESLKRKEALHRAESEKRQRIEWRAHQQKLDELRDVNKTVLLQKKEIAQLNERYLSKQKECEKLEAEVKRLKSIESWSSVSPSSSTDDLTSAGQITRRERDMAMRNSELSFRIRTLEDNITILKEQKHSLQTKFTSICNELSPLRDQNGKLKIRCNELNSILRLRERKVTQLSQELLDVKSSNQQLQEEYEKQQKYSKQQFNHLSEYRTEKQKLILKNGKLKEAYEKLSARIKELEENNSKLLEQSLTLSLPSSPFSTVHDDDSLSSSSSQLQEQIDQLEFDKDELEAKYEEMKNEFKEIREKYRSLHHRYQQLQIKHDDTLLQIQRKNCFVQMSLEREVMMLRTSRARENLTDVPRHEFILLAQDEKLKNLVDRIDALENFIIEQDEVLIRLEAKWKEECEKNFVKSKATEVVDPNTEIDHQTLLQSQPSHSLHVIDKLETSSADASVSVQISETKPVRENHGSKSDTASNTDLTFSHSVEATTAVEPPVFDDDTDSAIPSLQVIPCNKPESVFIPHVQINTKQEKESGLEASSEPASDSVPPLFDTDSEEMLLKQYKDIVQSLEDQLEESNVKNRNLYHQLTESQANSQKLLEELEQKFKTQADQKHTELLKTTQKVTLNNGTIDRDVALELLQEINHAFTKMEAFCSAANTDDLILKQLHTLKNSLDNLLQIIVPTEYLQGDANSEEVPCGLHMNKVVNKDDGDFVQIKGMDSLQEFNRLFVVVMDYDPHSLCITGQPDLELSVQSGAIISVFGQMDENGYYTASHQNSSGKVPANFVQEIELFDEELISRITSQNYEMWSTHFENETFKGSTRSGGESMLAMSSTSLDSDQPNNSDIQDHGYKLYLALYDYNPHASSSSANPEFELHFKEGSLIKVFGQKMSDGYYVGELNSQRGLVPAEFIADTSQYLELSSLHLKSKVMVALYDYQPEKDSPNAFPDTELEFKAGDQIVIVGFIHNDGFYTGQLRGKFGLVPSNYVKEL